MKKTLFAFALLVATTISLNAQITEAHITYKMDVVTDDAMTAHMMKESKLELYFKGDKSKTIMDMGSMMNTTIIINPSAKNSLTLIDVMGQKSAILLSKEDLETDNDETDLNVKLTNETKTILGYKCKKAIVINESGSETVFWYTESLKLNPQGQSNFNGAVPGVPLEYNVVEGEMKITFLATSVDKSVDDKEFDVSIPEGYEITTMDALGW